MSSDIAILFIGIILTIVFVAIGTYFLQLWLLLRRVHRAPVPNEEANVAEYLYFEEKLSANYGDELPVTKIKAMLSIPNSVDKIILLEYTHAFPNVLRCHSNGWMVWRGEMPTPTNDAYTWVEWQGQDLKAFSESCYLVRLDPEKGEILSYEFTGNPVERLK